MTWVAAVLLLVLAGCSAEAVGIPEFAVGATGPAVLNVTGLIVEWELVNPDVFEAGLANRSGRYTGKFGIDTTTLESTEIVVSWFALPCQQAPVAHVALAGEDIHIDITPGPSPGDCAAMSVHYALRLRLSEPLGNRTVSATLIDSIAQRAFNYIRP